MSAIPRLAPPVVIQPVNLQPKASTLTIKKICGVVLSILAVIALAPLSGVRFGLFVAGAVGLFALAASTWSREKVQPQRIARNEAEDRHFRSLKFPFDDTLNLRLSLVVHLGDMDLTQVQLMSIQNVSYEQVYKPMGGNFIEGVYPCDGYAIDLQTPNGPARYYVDLNGEHVTRPEDSQNVFAR